MSRTTRAGELRVDDAAMTKLLAAGQATRTVEQREPSRRSAAARRAVDLAVREHRDVALSQRALTLLLPEDHAVDVPELRLEWVDDVLPGFDLALELAAELDQARELARLDPLLDGGVEGTTERDVDRALAELDTFGPDERGHVAEAHRSHATVLDARPRVEPTRGDVDDDVVLALLLLDDALVERPRDERDRPVPARGRIAGVVEEDDAEVRFRVLRLDDEAAVHVGVPARLVHEQPPNVVEPVVRVAPLVEDRRTLRRLYTVGDDPEWLTRGVVVDRTNFHKADPSCDRPRKRPLQGSPRDRDSALADPDRCEKKMGRWGSVVERGPSAPRESSTARQRVAVTVW